MNWTVRVGKQDVLTLGVPDHFIQWLLPRARDSCLATLDPYRDRRVEGEDIEAVEGELDRNRSEWVAEISDRLQRERLPANPASRDAMLTHWIEQEMAGHEHRRMLDELRAAVTLARESGGYLQAFGD